MYLIIGNNHWHRAVNLTVDYTSASPSKFAYPQSIITRPDVWKASRKRILDGLNEIQRCHRQPVADFGSQLGTGNI